MLRKKKDYLRDLITNREKNKSNIDKGGFGTQRLRGEVYKM